MEQSAVMVSKWEPRTGIAGIAAARNCDCTEAHGKTTGITAAIRRHLFIWRRLRQTTLFGRRYRAPLL
ncbi:hypothetical protein PIB30_057861 [Stylosanthes scabra]|uniref:Uncharacterized protein n=1 Tax=Stylosanthes scabra TaxID=79078 RepID=A0ABU6ZIJ5_9FABA|nr:hypothetical protein [Stylosanthes scabra]